MLSIPWGHKSTCADGPPWLPSLALRGRVRVQLLCLGSGWPLRRPRRHAHFLLEVAPGGAQLELGWASDAGLDGGGGLAWGRLGPTCCLCVQVAFQRKSPPAPSLQPP